MKLSCLLLSALFCIGLGLAAKPPETDDEFHERTLKELGSFFHDGLLQLLPNNPKDNLKPLMQLYYLIQVISAYRHTPAHYQTELDTLIHDLVDEEFQERLRWAIRRLHKLENIRALAQHPSIAENPHDKEGFVNDIRRLLPAIHRALGAIHLERLHDPALRIKLTLLRQKVDSLTAEVIYTEYALLAFLSGGQPGHASVLHEAREAAGESLLQKPEHGAGLLDQKEPDIGGFGASSIAGLLKEKKKLLHKRLHHKQGPLSTILRAKKAFFKKLLHEKRALLSHLVHKKKQILKDLLDRQVDFQTLVDDIVENLNEQRRIFTETMNKNGEILSEMLQNTFSSSGDPEPGSFSETFNKVTEPISSVAEGIVNATKEVVADALHKKQAILKKVLHKPKHHKKHHKKGVVKQIIDKKKHVIASIIKSPLEILKPEEEVSHLTDVHGIDVRYEYENEPFEFKPENYEPEEKPSGRRLDSEEFESSEDPQWLEQKEDRLWITEAPESRFVDNDAEVTQDYWTSIPAGKTTTTTRPVYEEDLEAAAAESEPTWLAVHEELEDHEREYEQEYSQQRSNHYKSEIDLDALYQVSNRILNLVAMLEEGAGFTGLNSNISSNDMALVVNHLAQQELDKMEEDRGITQSEIIESLKWLIEFKEVPDAERMLEVLELWKQAELLQAKVNGKNGTIADKLYLVKETDELEDDLGEDTEYDVDYEWEEASMPKTGDEMMDLQSRMSPDDLLDSAEGSADDSSMDPPIPKEDSDLTEPLKEKSPADQETQRIQPFPEERPDETEPLEVV